MSGNGIEPLMTLEEVAGVLRLTPKTIRNRVYRGTMSAVHVGGRIRFERAEIQRIIEEGRTQKRGAA